MMAVADLHAALVRRIYVMTVDQIVTRTSAIPEQISHNALTVARKFAPLF